MATPSGSPVAGEQHVILVVGDDEGEHRRVEQLLHTRERVLHARSASEALAAFKQHGPDCVLLDYPLRDVPGFELLQRLVEQGATVILITGHMDDALAAEAIKTGAQDYLEKTTLTAGVLSRALRYAVERCRVLRERDKALQEKQLLNQEFQQAQKMEAIGRLAGGIAHDFNNILTIILMFARLSLDRLRDDDPRRFELVEILKAADRAEGLTRQLLAFSRKEVVEPKHVNINALIQNFEKMLRRMIGEDVALETFYCDDLGTVLIDPGQMEQVIINLAINARDAMPNGGRLRLSTALQPGDALPVRLLVQDEGTGMSPEVRDRIFEPFFTTKDSGKGTGLGLSTCYGIIKQAGGHILVESELGKGTTFIICLPQSNAAATAAAPGEAAGKDETGQGQTVIVAEDDEAIRTLLLRVLARAGYDVHFYDDVERSVAAHADLLVTDLIMPNTSGVEVAQELRQLNPRLAVVYMTGYTDRDNVLEDVERGEALLLRKPFDESRLLHSVRMALNAKTQEDSANAARRPAQTRKLLFIDDDARALASYERAFRDVAKVTCISGRAEELMAAIRKDNFDLILCDILMPDVSGIQLFELVAKEDRRLADKFVFVTSAADNPRVKEFCCTHNRVLIEKPLTRSALSRLLEMGP